MAKFSDTAGINLQKANAQPQQPAKKKLSLVDFLPAIGGTIGSLGAGALTGGLGAIGGGTAGSALGEALREKLAGESLSGKKIAGQGALGAVGELGGLALGAGLKAVTGGGAKLAEMGAEQLANRGFSATPTAAKNFSEAVGMYPGKFAAQEGLVGADAGTVAAAKNALNRQYSSALAGQSFDPASLDNVVNSRIAKLRGNAATQREADALETEFGVLKNVLGKDTSLSALNNQKSAYYRKAPSGSFLDPTTANVNNTLGDSLKEIIDGASSAGATRNLGTRLNGLNRLEDMARLADARGAVKSPASLSNINGGIGGAILSGGNPLGALAGAGLAAAANSGKVASAAAKGLFSASDALGSDALARALLTGGRTVGGASASSIPALLSQSPGQQEDQRQQPEIPSLPLQNVSPEPAQDNPYTRLQAVYPQLLVADLADDGKLNSGIDTIFEALKGIYGQDATKQTATQAKNQAFGERAAAADRTIGSNQDSYDKQGFIGQAVQGKLPNVLKNQTTQSNDQAEREFVNAILRQESGAAISPSEFENYRQAYFPQPGDSKATINQKAAARARAINSLYLQAGGSDGSPQLVYQAS